MKNSNDKRKHTTLIVLLMLVALSVVTVPTSYLVTLSSAQSSNSYYEVTFEVVNLKNGTPWYIKINGSTYFTTNGLITVQLPAGFYCFVAIAPGYSEESYFYVIGNESIPVVFIPTSGVTVYLNVTFTAENLPPGTTWYLYINGTNHTATSQKLTLQLPPGNYSYKAYAPGFTPISGIVNVNSNVNVTLSFSRVIPSVTKFNVTFIAYNLPAGTLWYLTVNGSPYSSRGSEITVTLKPGLYVYNATAPGYYPISGMISVSGNKVVPLHFKAKTMPINTSKIGFVKYTLVLFNNTLLPGNVLVVDSGIGPTAVAVNPNTGYVYEVNQWQGTVDVVNPYINLVVANISLGEFTYPTSVAYDPNNNYLYVTESGADKVAVVDLATDKVIMNISVGAYPIAVAFDQVNGYIYVANFDSNTVSVIDPDTNRVIVNVSVGQSPIALAVNPSNGFVYVANSGSNTVSVINPQTNSVTATVPTGGEYSDALAYDPLNGYLYVVNFNSGTITVINTANDQVVGTITVGGGPRYVIYDPLNGYLYVAQSASSTVAAIDSQTNRVLGNFSVGDVPVALAYDPLNGYLYVANFDSGTISILETPKTVSETYYYVTFTAENLPPGTTWYLYINGQNHTVTSQSITLQLPPGFYYYLAYANGYYTVKGSVNVNSNTNVDIYFVQVPLYYYVTFTAENLPPGTTWYLYINGQNISSRTPVLIVGLSPGTYSYIAYAPGYGPVSGVVSVSSNTTVYLYFKSVAPTNNVGYVEYTLILSNNTLVPGNVVFVNKEVGPMGLAYGNGYVFVPELLQHTVAIISQSSYKIVREVYLGQNEYPTAVAYDPQNGYIYVASIGAFQVIVINPGTGQIVANITIGNPQESKPLGIMYDPQNGYIYVANSGLNSVSVINPYSYQVIANISTGGSPVSMTYDPVNGYIYATNLQSNSVSVIDPSTNRVVANIPVGEQPVGIMYDPQNGYIYVANSMSNTTSVIDPSMNEVVYTIPVGLEPDAVTYNPKNGYIYVANYWSNSISVISNTTNEVIGTIEVGDAPVAVIYDPDNGYMYVANFGSGTISIISTSILKFYVTFEAENLPSGTTWHLFINGYNYTVTSQSITLYLPEGSYVYTAYAPGYGPVSGVVSVSSNTTVYLYFKSVIAPYYKSVLIPYLYNSTAWGTIYLNFTSAELSLSMPGVMLGNLSTPGIYIPNDQSHFNYRLAGPFVVNITIDGWKVYGFTFITLPTYANGTVVNYTYKMQKTLIIAYNGNQIIALLYYKSLAPVPLLLSQYWSHIHKGTDGLQLAIWPSDFNPYLPPSPGLVTQAYYLHGNTSVYINGSYVGQLNSFGLWQVLPVGPILMVNKLGGWNVSIVVMDNMSSTPQIQLVTNGFFINSTKVDNSYFNIQHGAITLYPGQAAQYVYAIGLNSNPPNYYEIKDLLSTLLGLTNVSYTNSSTTKHTSSSTNNVGYVEYTLILSNNTLLPGNVGSISSTLGPQGIVYDPQNGYIYVTLEYNNSVAVIDPNTNHVIATVHAGPYPIGLVYDSRTSYIYVADFLGNEISVIDPANNSVIKTIGVGPGPIAITCDPNNGYLYVADYDNGRVVVVDPFNNSVVGAIVVGQNPDAIAYDPANGYIYVANFNSNTVSVINPSSNEVVTSISIPGPDAIAYDSQNSYIYIAEEWTSSVAVINSANQVVENITNVGYGPDAIAYDSQNGYLYVAEGSSNAVTVINPITGQILGNITVGDMPTAVLYDVYNGLLYVVNYGSGTISIVKT